jgi:hypothetical protein
MELEKFIKEECQLNPILSLTDEYIIGLVWNEEIEEKLYPNAEQGSLKHNIFIGCIIYSKLTPVKEILKIRDEIHPFLKSNKISIFANII